MASIRVRKSNGFLFFDFRYSGARCREYTILPDTPANRRKMEKVLEKIQAEITLGIFDYRKYFPNSPMAARFEAMDPSIEQDEQIPWFRDFAEQWYSEKEIEWKRSYAATIRHTFKKYLITHFGEMKVNRITKSDILQFRSPLAKEPGQKGGNLSADRINHIMTPLRMILEEAATRFDFTSPWVGIKPLKVPKTVIQPFSLDEVGVFLSNIRGDFHNYYTTRFFTGLRTGEIDGLKWKYVDFDKRQIVIHETLVDGQDETPKVPSSYREVQMSTLVYEALQRQQQYTGDLGPYVFCNREGTPLNHRNITRRIWYPTLEHLDLEKRRPYQTRHTAATLWLAAGENPEWIARQMGHTNTEMLFAVYSRYVPNLTRQDGSAFERLLQNNLYAEV